MTPYPCAWFSNLSLFFSQRIPVEMNCQIPKALMTLLEANSSGTTEVKELPLWLARGLKKSGFVNTSMPKAYGVRSLQKIKAGAAEVQLGQRYPYFYDVGAEVALLDGTQTGYDVVKTLEDGFAQRYKIILDRFHNTGKHSHKTRTHAEAYTRCRPQTKQASQKIPTAQCPTLGIPAW